VYVPPETPQAMHYYWRISQVVEMNCPKCGTDYYIASFYITSFDVPVCPNCGTVMIDESKLEVEKR
jgi:predicted RNA-binding Zn-ribbon protein involved in translation (DUF1610 family)